MTNRHLGLAKARYLLNQSQVELQRHADDAASAATPRLRWAARSMCAFRLRFIAVLETYLASVGHATGADLKLAFERWAASEVAAGTGRSELQMRTPGDSLHAAVEAAVIARRPDLVGELLQDWQVRTDGGGLQAYPLFWLGLAQGDEARARRAVEALGGQNSAGGIVPDTEHGFMPRMLAPGLAALLDGDPGGLDAAIERILKRHDDLAWPSGEGGQGIRFLICLTAAALLIEARARGLAPALHSDYAPAVLLDACAGSSPPRRDRTRMPPGEDRDGWPRSSPPRCLRG